MFFRNRRVLRYSVVQGIVDKKRMKLLYIGPEYGSVE
jgi:hypothetical protein